jgi:hypothetical protein
MGIVAVDGVPTVRSDASALFIEYYTYQARGEPKFVLQPADGAWFENFLGEAEALWSNAADNTFADSTQPSHQVHEAAPTGHLTRPRGGRVNRRDTVTGVVSYLPPNSQALIVIQTPQEQVYWPQARLRLDSEGGFTSEAKFGRVGNDDSGEEFILMLVVASSTAAAASLQSSLEDDNGMSSMPPDVLVLDKVTVIRS